VTEFEHRTVMCREVIDAIAPRAMGRYADVTLGGGGHGEAILDASGPDGLLVGVDRDPAALEASRTRLAPFGARAVLMHGSMSELRALLDEAGVARLDGIIADLGVSSPQLDSPERGFSFSHDGPLDMRMDPTRGPTARELIAELDEEELANVIYQLGEEHKSRRIAHALKRAEVDGTLSTTGDLKRAVHRVTGPKRGRIDPATRTFQALRIAVNRELDEVASLVAEAPDLLADGGVIAVIAFHSLEDRIVKRAFRSDARLSPLTKRPLVASDEEREHNPRSRSAKLRAARRVPREVAA
jgi:16S rRNA (cytosine1402-N4)-methyltransferase